MFAVHHVIGPSIGFACNHRYSGYRGFAKGVKQFSSVGDDRIPLLVCARKKTRNILKHEERYIKGIAKAHKASAFLAAMHIEHPCQMGWLVGHNANAAS